MTHPLATLIAGVKVKPLVWEDAAWAQSGNSAESALSQFGRYYVEHGAMYWGPGVVVSTGYPNLDAAKAAAQRDYEARILAALEAAPVPDLTDSVTVHANMLRGTIAKPTVEQIIHLYGKDVLAKALSAATPPDLVEEAVKVIERLEQRDTSRHGYTGHPLYNRDGRQAADTIRTLIALATAQAAQLAKADSLADAVEAMDLPTMQADLLAARATIAAQAAQIAGLEARLAHRAVSHFGSDSARADLHEKLKETKARAEAAEAEVERLRGVVERIDQWADAYPLEVFAEPDFAKADEVLKTAGLSLSAISASNMRHVIEGVKAITRSDTEGKA